MSSARNDLAPIRGVDLYLTLQLKTAYTRGREHEVAVLATGWVPQACMHNGRALTWIFCNRVACRSIRSSTWGYIDSTVNADWIGSLWCWPCLLGYKGSSPAALQLAVQQRLRQCALLGDSIICNALNGTATPGIWDPRCNQRPINIAMRDHGSSR